MKPALIVIAVLLATGCKDFEARPEDDAGTDEEPPTIVAIEGDGSTPGNFRAALIVTGTNFGPSPIVELDGVQLVVTESTDVRAVAMLPADVAGGNYTVRVRRAPGATAAGGEVTLLQGEQGPQGEPGMDGTAGVDGASATVVFARYSRGTQQTIPASGAVVDFSTMETDTHGAVTPGSLWHFTAPLTGVYQVQSQLRFESATWTAGSNVIMSLVVDGTSSTTMYYNTIETTRTDTVAYGVGSTSVWLNAGQTIHLKATHQETDRLLLDSGGGGSPYTWITITGFAAPAP